MSIELWVAIISTVLGSGGGLALGIGKAWRSSVQRAATEQQAIATTAALKLENKELRSENEELWGLVKECRKWMGEYTS